MKIIERRNRNMVTASVWIPALPFLFSLSDIFGGNLKSQLWDEEVVRFRRHVISVYNQG